MNAKWPKWLTLYLGVIKSELQLNGFSKVIPCSIVIKFIGPKVDSVIISIKNIHWYPDDFHYFSVFLFLFCSCFPHFPSLFFKSESKGWWGVLWCALWSQNSRTMTLLLIFWGGLPWRRSMIHILHKRIRFSCMLEINDFTLHKERHHLRDRA